VTKEHASHSVRPRVLFLSYDSQPIQELLWPLAEQLGQEMDCLFLAQFPETLRELRKRGFYARSIRSVLGWEHGMDSKALSSSAPHLMPLEATIEYELKSDPSASREVLIEQANAITHRFKELLDSWKPSLILGWNGHTLPFKPCLAYARTLGIPCRVLERGFFPRSLFIDARGTNSASAVKDVAEGSTETSEEHVRGLIQRLTKNYSPIVAQKSTATNQEGDVRRKLGLKESAFLFLVPEQLENDSNTVLFCDPLRTNGELLQKVGESLDALGRADAVVVYKTHPELVPGSSAVSQGFSKHVKISTNISVENLLRECDAVITRNSTVGFEGLLFGKRCITLGKSIYSEMGITDDVLELDKLTHTISEVMKNPALPESCEKNLLALVGRLHASHHYFVEPVAGEDTLNANLFAKLLEEARTHIGEASLPMGTLLHLPWRVRLEEALWGVRLEARELRNRLLKVLKPS